MRLLRRLLRDSQDLPGDIATGDWSPVPAGVSAQALDLEALLTEEVPLPRRAALDWEPGPEEAISCPPIRLRSDPRPPAAASRFTPEELAIIEEQRRAAAAPVAAPVQPVQPASVPEPRQSWVDVLKTFGESLTDSELRIIRQQLA
jgi:hypothetical protein